MVQIRDVADKLVLAFCGAVNRTTFWSATPHCPHQPSTVNHHSTVTAQHPLLPSIVQLLPYPQRVIVCVPVTVLRTSFIVVEEHGSKARARGHSGRQ